MATTRKHRKVGAIKRNQGARWETRGIPGARRRKNDGDGIKTPLNLIMRPLNLPPVVNIKNGEEPPEWHPSADEAYPADRAA